VIHMTLNFNQHAARYTMDAARNGTDTQESLKFPDGLNYLVTVGLCNFVYVCWFSKSGFKTIVKKLQLKTYPSPLKLQVGPELPYIFLSSPTHVPLKYD
jgi:hypothetical protein